MPPKKRLRGPNLAKTRERAESPILSEDDFHNSQDDDDSDIPVIREFEAMNLDKEKTLTEKRLRKLIVDAFRLTFQSRGNISQDISLATHKIYKAYQKAMMPITPNSTTNQIEHFFNEIDIRLTMMFDEVSVIEHRARVFKMMALTTAELMRTEEDYQLLGFMLNYLDTWGKSDNVAARINTASCASYLLETGLSKLDLTVPDTFCGYSLEVSERLFSHLKQSLTDREYQARVPAIRGVACLQNQPMPSNWGDEAKSSSPRELLMRSFRDVSWECRLTAMQSFTVKENDVQILSDIVLYDKCLKVRLAALDKFADLRPNRYVRFKVSVLDLCLKDHDVSVRDKAKDVLKTWVTKLSEKWTDKLKPPSDEIIEVNVHDDPIEAQEGKCKGYILAGQALVLLWLSDISETAEAHATLKRIVMHLLDVIRKMYICHQEPVNTFAETIISDLRDKVMASAVPIITKSTIHSILDTSEVALTQDAKANRALVFFWRCIVEYVGDRKYNQGDRTQALNRFLAPMKTMVEYVFRILHRLRNLETDPEYADVDSEMLYVIQMSIVENIVIVIRYAQPDQSGLDAYKSLLIGMMQNPCYQKKIVDIVVSELSQFYSDCIDDMFSLIQAKMTITRRGINKGLFSEREECIIVGERMMVDQYGEETGRDGSKVISNQAANGIMDAYELMVVNAALKVGLLKEYGNEYHKRYEEMFRRGTESKDMDSRILAIECVGIVGMYDFDKAKLHLENLVESFIIEDEEAVKAVLLTALTDLYIQNGPKVVDSVMGVYGTLVNLLTDIVMTEESIPESVLLLKAVEGLSRVLLQASIDPQSTMWQKAIVSLMFRASYAITDTFSARIRSTIISTLKFFCSLCKNNQILLVKAFPRFFDMWANTSNIGLLTTEISDIIPKLKRCAATFVALTRHSVLPPNEQKTKTATHCEMVDDILKVVTGSADSASVTYYLYALHCIDYNSFQRQALSKIHEDLADYIAVHEEDTDKHNYNELRRVSKKVAKILGLNENDEEIEEVPSRSDTRKQKRDREPMELEDFDDEPTTSQPQPTVRKPRPQRQGSVADPLDLITSPHRNPRKPPSRPATSNRPSVAPSTSRSDMPRSARNLRSGK